MKIIAIGDLHGSDHWKTINYNDWDKIVFIGDYVDSFVYSDAEIIHNLKEIIEFKKEDYEDKVILLWGNHDYMYWKYPANEVMCSGFRSSCQPQLSDLFIQNHTLFQVAYQIEKYLFTHAGVVSTWLKKHQVEYKQFQKDYDCKNIIEFLNMLPYTARADILSEVGWARGGWSTGSPIWADITETKKSMLYGYHQIVGHTHVREIDVHKMQNDTSVAYIDCLNPRAKEKFSFYNINI